MNKEYSVFLGSCGGQWIHMFQGILFRSPDLHKPVNLGSILSRYNVLYFYRKFIVIVFDVYFAYFDC